MRRGAGARLGPGKCRVTQPGHPAEVWLRLASGRASPAALACRNLHSLHPLRQHLRSPNGPHLSPRLQQQLLDRRQQQPAQAVAPLQLGPHSQQGQLRKLAE